MFVEINGPQRLTIELRIVLLLVGIERSVSGARFESQRCQGVPGECKPLRRMIRSARGQVDGSLAEVHGPVGIGVVGIAGVQLLAILRRVRVILRSRIQPGALQEVPELEVLKRIPTQLQARRTLFLATVVVRVGRRRCCART